MTDAVNKLDMLCKLTSSDYTLQEIVDKAFSLFGNPVHVTDMSRHILAYTKTEDIAHPRWLSDVVRDDPVTESDQQRERVRQIHNNSFYQKLPVYVADEEVPFPCYIKTLVGEGSKPIGVMILSAICKPFDEGDCQLLELLSGHVVKRLMQEHYAVNENERQLDNLLIKLLDGTLDRSVNVSQWLTYHQWKHHEYYYVATIHPDTTETEPAPLEGVLDELAFRPYCRTVIYDNTIVHIMTRRERIASVESDEAELLRQVERWNMIMGISREFSDPFHLREAYLEAMTALRLGLQYGKGRCFTYDRYAVYHVLESLPKGVDPVRFCNSKILTLASADQTEDKELLTTLHTYLRNARNMTKTAEELFIHRNTVRYRLNKCMDILQSELEDGDEIFAFLLSLKIIEYWNEVSKKIP